MNCGRKPNRKNHFSKSNFRSVLDKKYRWLHNLLRVHGIELQSEMIICSQCRNAFYKENKRDRSSNVGSIGDDDDLKEYLEEENEKPQPSIFFDNLLILDDIYGNGNDYIYCIFCMKSGVETTPLSLSRRMTFLCDHKLYTSPNAPRCTNSCYDMPRKRPHERTQLSTKQASELIYDLTTELSRVKAHHF